MNLFLNKFLKIADRKILKKIAKYPHNLRYKSKGNVIFLRRPFLLDRANAQNRTLRENDVLDVVSTIIVWFGQNVSALEYILFITRNSLCENA
jgi:hypothetical protein